MGIFIGYLVYDRRRLRAIEPAFLANGWYYDQTVTAFMGGPGEAAFDGTATFDAKVIDGAVDGTARASARRAQRLRRSQSGYVRNYALGIGVGAVLLLGWFVARGLDVMNGFPLLTAIIVLPALGALVVALMPKSRPELIRPVAVAITVAELALTVSLLASFETARRGLPVPLVPHLDRAVGDRVEPRGRRHLALPRGADRAAVPAGPPRRRPPPRRQALHGVDPAPRGRAAWARSSSLDLFLFFIFFEIVLVPMYFLIGGWGYADRVYAAIKFFLFTMTGSAFMLVGILSTVFLYAQQNGGRLTFDVVDIAQNANFATHDGPMAVRLLRRRLRGEGADLPAAHLAARRPHPGAHRGLGHPGRRHAEARHVRVAALRAVPVPGGRALVRARCCSPSA